MRHLKLAILLVCICTAEGFGQARGPAAAPPDVAGVYVSIPDGVTLPGGLRNSGSPAEITLTPDAARRMNEADVKQDPLKLCQMIGPFRMMARDRTTIEIVPSVQLGVIVMLFEDVAHGQMRRIYLNRGHLSPLRPSWLGDSIGRWDNGTLVIDTVGFNDRTWLNDQGAPHTDALHLVERVRPVAGGKYLEYRVTADDAGALVRPYSYVRYYEKIAAEIAQDICEAEL